MSLNEFMSAFTNFILNFYSWTTSIYPFQDIQISLFWILESSVLTNLAWQLFPHDLADNFTDDDNTYIV